MQIVDRLDYEKTLAEGDPGGDVEMVGVIADGKQTC